MLVFSGLYCLFMGFIALYQGSLSLWAADHGMFVVLASLMAVLRLRHALIAVGTVATWIAGFFFLLLVGIGGVDQSAFVWLLTYPIIALVFLGARQGTIASTVILVSATALLVISNKTDWLTPIYHKAMSLRIVAAYLTIYFLTLIMELTRHSFYARLEVAHRDQIRTAALLAKNDMEKARIIKQLEKSLSEVNTLRGLIPVCTDCKKVRDDDGYWNELGQYLVAHTDSVLTHGICPDCAVALYGDFLDELKPDA